MTMSSEVPAASFEVPTAAPLRVEDRRLLRGRGRFVDNLPIDDALVACFVRSPHAAALIDGVDARAALALDGVVAVFTAGNLPGAATPLPVMIPHPDLPDGRMPGALAAGRVRFAGEAVALVVARDRYVAEDAAERVVVEWQPLPVVSGIAAALDGAVRVHEDLPDNVAGRSRQRAGDPEAAFARADRHLRFDLRIHRGSAQPMETRAVAAVPGLGGSLRVWASTQAPHRLRAVLAQILGEDPETIRVTAPDVGGGFGAKGYAYPEYVAVALAARALGRPVRWMDDRRENLLAMVQERDQWYDVEVALDATGRVTALRARIFHDMGAYAPYSFVQAGNAMVHLPGPYRIEHLDIEAVNLYTNAVPTGPLRGAGRPQGALVMERVMDRVARATGADPAEVRRRHFVPVEAMPYATGLKAAGRPVRYDGGDYRLAFETALSALGPVPEPSAGMRWGRGVAAYVESTGSGPFEGCRVWLDEQGILHAASGSSPQGQGHETTLGQLVAHALGLPFGHVQVHTGDTGLIPRGIGTFGSRTAPVAGPAAAAAAARLRRQILEFAAGLLEVAPGDLSLDEEGVSVRGAPSRRRTFAELARQAAAMGRVLEAVEYFEPPGNTWSYGAMGVIVGIDEATGSVTIRDAVFVHDCGPVIHPVIVEGQVMGGIAHGIGNALLEEAIYDASGQLLTATWMDYLLPGACEVPQVRMVHLHTPTDVNPLGLRGAGEGGVMPVAAALAQAIEDACGGRIWLDRFPMTGSRLWQALQHR
ncbi:MAG TPA: xanthine dehydrogenase family protein molybdopterin-binding subunit [Bacillota bacterium]